jgi:hypothetical protein
VVDQIKRGYYGDGDTHLTPPRHPRFEDISPWKYGSDPVPKDIIMATLPDWTKSLGFYCLFRTLL